MPIDDETNKLVMVPGPTPVHRKILDALGEPTIWHSSSEMARVIGRCQRGICQAAGTRDGRAFLFGGSGTLAQEAAVVNVVAPGERLLVASNGYFGDRFAAIAESYGIEVDHIRAPWGRSVTPDQLRARLHARPARAVTITHVDTSTGTAAPVEDLVPVARESGALVILDSVCGLGGMPVEMDRMGIDIVLSGAQKALGVPPGLAILVVSPRALDRRRQLARVPAFYADLLNWEASMDTPETYFSTHAVNQFYALAAGLDMIEHEGLSQRYERHLRLASAFRAATEVLGFWLCTETPYLAPTLSVLAYPPGTDDERFRQSLGRHGIVVAPNMGSFKGKGVRVGHMGNIGDSDILRTVAAIEGTLLGEGMDAHVGAGVAAAQRVLATHSALSP